MFPEPQRDAPGTGAGAWCVVVTCEHAGNAVPAEYAGLFASHAALLSTHRGYDIGAYGVARRMAESVAAPLIASTTTRLLVEANRSAGEAGHFSVISGTLPAEEKARVIERYYRPHRSCVETVVGALIASGRRVLHVGVHSFTDVMDDVRREMDYGVLFDPARPEERRVAEDWAASIGAAEPGARVRLNEPYLGTDDGLTTALRAVHADGRYAGLEIEVRQGLILTVERQVAVGAMLAATAAGVRDG